MGQEILIPVQKKIIAYVAEVKELQQFYLSGGTALAAYYLRHRLSDDLDFFAEADIDMLTLHACVQEIKRLLGANEARYERLYDRNQFFFEIDDEEEVKVEFTKYPFAALDARERHNGIMVDSFRDIAANKLMAMLDRFDPKDFVDLYFILKEKNLGDVRKDTEKKFGIKIGGLLLGSEIAKVRRITALPKMLKPLGAEELKSFFSELAKSLSSEVLE